MERGIVRFHVSHKGNGEVNGGGQVIKKVGAGVAGKSGPLMTLRSCHFWGKPPPMAVAIAPSLALAICANTSGAERTFPIAKPMIVTNLKMKCGEERIKTSFLVRGSAGDISNLPRKVDKRYN